MKIWDAFKNFYAKVDSILDCFVLYLVACFLDDLSSLHIPLGMQESNPFSRHPDGSFWLRHAFINSGINTVELGFLSTGCYIGARTLGARYARFAATLPWLYFAYLHLDAAFTNLQYEIPGLYVQTAHDLLQRLLGQ